MDIITLDTKIHRGVLIEIFPERRNSIRGRYLLWVDPNGMIGYCNAVAGMLDYGNNDHQHWDGQKDLEIVATGVDTLEQASKAVADYKKRLSQ